MRLLVDTSVWIDHFQRADVALQAALHGGEVWTHEVVIGELAAGRLARREDTLTWLRHLPRAGTCRLEEGLRLIERHDLSGRGLSWADIQLLAAARLDHCMLWTRDRALAAAATKLAVRMPPPG